MEVFLVIFNNPEPEELRESFANFRPVFKDINAGRHDIGPFMK